MDISKEAIQQLKLQPTSKEKMEYFIRNIPKVELHIHIEGSLEPKLMLEIADRNGSCIKYKTIDEIERAYDFQDLQSFLDVYYEGTAVLQTEQDFYDMTWDYLKKAHNQNVVHAEIFFDPQAHTERGVPFETVITGINRALKDGRQKLGISVYLIMCFLRHLSQKAALKTLDEAVRFKDFIVGVGLDSTELGNPPSKFKEVFKKARNEGLLPVAHAGEEGPASYIREALDQLNVLRVDHGVRCIEDNNLVKELKERQVPLTICPISNVKLKVFNTLEEHNLKLLLDMGLRITLNSDDPAYFGGYINENFLLSQQSLGATHYDIYQLARNGVKASFLGNIQKQKLLEDINGFVLSNL